MKTTDLHNWDTIEELAIQELDTVGCLQWRDLRRGSHGIGYPRSHAEFHIDEVKVLVSGYPAGLYFKAFKRLVRDHVRPCV